MGPRDGLLRNLLNIFKIFEANVLVFGHMLIKKTENSVAGVCNHYERFVINVNSLLSLSTVCNHFKQFIISVNNFVNHSTQTWRTNYKLHLCGGSHCHETISQDVQFDHCLSTVNAKQAQYQATKFSSRCCWQVRYVWAQCQFCDFWFLWSKPSRCTEAVNAMNKTARTDEMSAVSTLWRTSPITFGAADLQRVSLRPQHPSQSTQIRNCQIWGSVIGKKVVRKTWDVCFGTEAV